MDGHLVDGGIGSTDCIGGDLLNLKFGFGRDTRLRQGAVEVAVNHGNRARGEVAETVG